MKVTIYVEKGSLTKYSSISTQEYVKRLNRYCKITTQEVSSLEQIHPLDTNKLFFLFISKESDTITSEHLAKSLQDLGTQGHPWIGLVLLDSFSDNGHSTPHFALTKMDFSMDTYILMLYEQIYRSFRIIHGEPYHK